MEQLKYRVEPVGSLRIQSYFGGILKRLSFPKTKRLTTNRQFKAVLDNKLHVRDDLLILYMAENDCGYPRLGVSIGKVHGNAVVRNTLKRRLREAFRQSQAEIPADFDYLLMISPQWKKKYQLSTVDCRLVKRTFLTLVDKAVSKK